MDGWIVGEMSVRVLVEGYGEHLVFSSYEPCS